MNFTLLHDDGQLPHDLDEADVVLLGVSRTSKTPTAIYLANRGVKTANIPLVPGVPPPQALETLRKPLVVGLVATPERIVQIRQNRLLSAEGRRRHGLCRPRRGRRGDRVLAPALRPPQLADHRRDAPLDRGDRRGDPRPLPRPPPEVHRGVMPCLPSLWTRRASRCSSPRRARPAACCSSAPGLPVETRSARRRRARGRSGRGRSGSAAGARAPARGREGARGQPPPTGRSWSAPTRCSRCDGAIFHKPADARGGAGAARAALRAHAPSSTAAVACAGRRICATVSRRGALTMRALDDAAHRRAISTCRRGRARSVGGYQIEGLGIHLFERIEGDHSTILGLPLLPLLAALRRLGLLASCEAMSMTEGLRRRPSDQAFALAADPRLLAASSTGLTAPTSASTSRRRISTVSCAALPSNGFRGGNVTIPHKEAAFRLRRRDDRAGASG